MARKTKPQKKAPPAAPAPARYRCLAGPLAGLVMHVARAPLPGQFDPVYELASGGYRWRGDAAALAAEFEEVKE